MAGDRERLLRLLLRQGILHASPTQPVRSRDGTPARWMLDSLGVTLESEGLQLAARCLLPLLDRFEGRQIATFGTTAIPLVAACVAASEGRYHGLLVRKERKSHGSSKRIEGRIERDEPVILLDDSVSSGTAMNDGRQHLEKAGLWVEGGVCLVRFGWDRGIARMMQDGLHMEAVFDIYDDVMAGMDAEPDPLANPTKVLPPVRWSTEAAPEGLHPAHLARRVMEHRLRTGELLRPPSTLDAKYDSTGGAYVSVRDREQIYQRYGREGFWHFPEEIGPEEIGPEEIGPEEIGPTPPNDAISPAFQELPPSAPRDIVLAAHKTLALLPEGEEGLATLGRSLLAVTLFSALESCTVGQLDNQRYGIVVRSRERTGVMGGALPRMPGLRDSWGQFQHARIKNGKLISFEPYEVLRHDVTKLIEPGAHWQPTGVPKSAETPWFEDAEIAGHVALRARQLALKETLGEETASPVELPALPDTFDAVFVSVYVRGRLRGCVGSSCGTDAGASPEELKATLQQLVPLALEDGRFDDDLRPGSAEELAVTVSLLHQPLTLGVMSPEEVMPRIRLGEQALKVSQGTREGLLLPFVASSRHPLAHDFAAEVIDKAGVTRPPYTWHRWECATWLADAFHGACAERPHGTPRQLRGTFPPIPSADGSAAQRVQRLTGLYVRYLLRHQKTGEDAAGSFYFRYKPHPNVLVDGIDLPRLAHTAWTVARAARLLDRDDLRQAADRTVEHLLKLCRCFEPQDDAHGGWWLQRDGEEAHAAIAEVAFLLLALCERAEDAGQPQIQTQIQTPDETRMAPRLAETLWASIDRLGYVSTHRIDHGGPGSLSKDDLEAYQDFYPGQALLALARAAEQGFSAPSAHRLAAAFRRARHRYRHQHHFGQAPWQAQAWTAWARVETTEPTQRDAYHAFVAEIADHVLEHQVQAPEQRDRGAFLTPLQQGPGFTTALFLEVLAAAMQLEEQVRGRGSEARQRYRHAHELGVRFLDTLTLQEPMLPLLPAPEWAYGGVRQDPYYDEVRVDFVSHALSALLPDSAQRGVPLEGASHQESS